MQVWPFKPLSEMIEALEWRTDVIRTKADEQRFALRREPRTTYNLEHKLNPQEYSAARAMIQSAELFYVPVWDRPASITGASSGTSVSIDFDETDLDLEPGDPALIWVSVIQFEQITVESVSSSGITAESVLGDWGTAKLLALKTCQNPQGFLGQRPAGPLMDVQVAMIATDSEDIGASDYPQYRGHDLVNECPVVASARFNEPILWPVDTVDNEVGVPRYLRFRDYPDQQFAMRWHKFTREEKYTLRQFLHSRRGRWKSFWLSSYGRDLLPAVDIAASDDSIRVFSLPGIDNLGTTNFDLEIKAGSLYQFQVTDVTPAASVDGKPTLALQISPLGVSIPKSSIERISYLRCVRFNSDRMELSHRASAGMTVQVPCMEVMP